MRTRCETCGRTWGAETPLGLKAEATVTSCAWCECDGFRSRLEELRGGPTKPTAARKAVLGKLLPANVQERAEKGVVRAAAAAWLLKVAATDPERYEDLDLSRFASQRGVKLKSLRGAISQLKKAERA